MHAIETSSSSGLEPTSYVPCVRYTSGQNGTDLAEQRVGALVTELTARRQFFYGIEVVALQGGKPTCLDFNSFLPVLPTFVSIVWLGLAYCHVNPIDQVKSLQLARSLESRIPVMPHISAYCLSQERLDQFLALNFTNVLPIRGDAVHETQNFQYSWQVVDYLRRQRGENISICVAGYPEGYTSLPERQDPVQAMKFLKKKIAAGADCIITQMCYRSATIIQFIRDCRSAGITVPIVVGQTVADCFRTYRMSENIAGVHLPPDQRAELLQLKSHPQRVTQFFVQLSIRIIRDILDADLGVYGIQFYTFNKFEPVYEVLKELRSLDILKDADGH
ncbi:5,10-methylenetetrahydrofolate reductase [Drosophila obscura]|uniref:5,10-methylenetetrahydrofolate reductase n=1 Tax=Drosophila obscura TaxID=7282 RepID=UPI001BB268F7|nr:5,10-methylenetetrahydrofolate reductase [Drosophila obscura]